MIGELHDTGLVPVPSRFNSVSRSHGSELSPLSRNPSSGIPRADSPALGAPAPALPHLPLRQTAPGHRPEPVVSPITPPRIRHMRSMDSVSSKSSSVISPGIISPDRSGAGSPGLTPMTPTPPARGRKTVTGGGKRKSLFGEHLDE